MMTPTARFALILALPLVVSLAMPADAQTVATTARVIVKYRQDSSLLRGQPIGSKAAGVARVAKLSAETTLDLAPGAPVDERSEVVFARGMTSEELARRLSAFPEVEYAVPDQRMRAMAAPNDPLYLAGGATGPAAGQWYLRTPSGPMLAAIDAEPAWAITTGNPSVVVAVLDTGVRYDHPDLLSVGAGGNLLPGYDMVADSLEGNDGDGRDADASDPGTWVTAAEANDPISPFYRCTPLDSTGRYVAQDSSWHGTQTAGLIGALTGNGVGMASVGRTVRIVPVRVLGKCGHGNSSDIIAGMLWAAGLTVPGTPANPNPARVINMSLGGEGSCTAAYQDAVTRITAAGVTIVVSAGNESTFVSHPANCNGAIAVAGLRHVGTKVGFSSLGPEVSIATAGGNCVNTGAGSACLYPILTTTNNGTAGPTTAGYSDSYRYSTGTSFSAPLVAGTAALMLSVQPSLTPSQVKQLLESSSRVFPTTKADAAPGEVVAQCVKPTNDAGGSPVEQSECICTQQTCGAGMLDAGAAVRAAATGFPATGLSAQGLWWSAPAESESGWGINLAHQGDAIFATWYTYDASGKAMWLSMTATRSSAGVYGGEIVRTGGPAYSSTPFNSALVTRTVVGSGTLTFVNADYATFAYTVSGVAQSKRITRQVYGSMPTCAWGASSNPSAATNYQDLWWNAPANSESGWGLSLTQQSDVIFAVWYTYDLDSSPLWLSGTLTRSGAGYGGTLYRTLGPAFSAVPFLPTAVTRTAVGNATLTFADGNTATFAYTVGGLSQSKSVTRQIFYPPAATICR
jgi:serine protease